MNTHFLALIRYSGEGACTCVLMSLFRSCTPAEEHGRDGGSREETLYPAA